MQDERERIKQQIASNEYAVQEIEYCKVDVKKEQVRIDRQIEGENDELGQQIAEWKEELRSIVGQVSEDSCEDSDDGEEKALGQHYATH